MKKQILTLMISAAVFATSPVLASTTDRYQNKDDAPKGMVRKAPRTIDNRERKKESTFALDGWFPYQKIEFDINFPLKPLRNSLQLHTSHVVTPENKQPGKRINGIMWRVGCDIPSHRSFNFYPNTRISAVAAADSSEDSSKISPPIYSLTPMGKKLLKTVKEEVKEDSSSNRNFDLDVD